MQMIGTRISPRHATKSQEGQSGEFDHLILITHEFIWMEFSESAYRIREVE